MTPREFTLIADESTQKGPRYSNFFGGLLISSDRVEPVSSALAEEKLRLNLRNEVKWKKTSRNYLEKYIQLVSFFFNFVRSGDVKVRIMFTLNSLLPRKLSKHHRANKYSLLYYQFIEHAFDYRYSDLGPGRIYLQIRLDNLPGTPSQKQEFFASLYALNGHSKEFLTSNDGEFHIRTDAIGEIDSRESDLLQCLDVLLGAMQFRLNRGYATVDPVTRKMASKTIAKDKLSTQVLNLVRGIVPDFQPGLIPWVHPDLRWKTPYRHRIFRPLNGQF
ncbi:MAG: hypothetical protein OXH77_00605 [Anaerolineaceae bacterium]|nr:hypothetical protein [Anaerolineaceae bacterium]